MSAHKRSGDWYSPYFAPSTIVVGILVIVVSVSAGRYVGNIMIERDESRYAPQANLIEPAEHLAPTKVTHHASPVHENLSPSANIPH